MKEEEFKIMKDYLESADGFIKYNHIKVDSIKQDYAKCFVELTKESMNPMGICHGGLLYGLADTTMGIAARTTGKNLVTVDSNISFLRAGKGKKIECVAEPIKIGSNFAFYSAKIYSDDTLIATATGTYVFLK